jgi:hypothetical protein
MYINSHVVVTTTFLIWLYLARNQSYYYVRNMFMVAMGLALALYVVYPTAPPRFMPGVGLLGHGHRAVGQASGEQRQPALQPYAAVPSMHVAFRADGRDPGLQDRAVALPEGGVGDLPADRHDGRAGHRESLVARRRVRGNGRGDERRSRKRRAADARGRGLGVAHARPRSQGHGDDQQRPGEPTAPEAVGRRAASAAAAEPQRRGYARARDGPPDRVAAHAPTRSR